MEWLMPRFPPGLRARKKTETRLTAVVSRHLSRGDTTIAQERVASHLIAALPHQEEPLLQEYLNTCLGYQDTSSVLWLDRFRACTSLPRRTAANSSGRNLHGTVPSPRLTAYSTCG